MSRAVWSMPVSVEQIAVVVRRMSPEERRRLVKLAPELREMLAPVRTLPQARESARVLQDEMLERLGGELLGADEAFLGGLTLEEYWGLPDKGPAEGPVVCTELVEVKGGDGRRRPDGLHQVRGM